MPRAEQEVASGRGRLHVGRLAAGGTVDARLGDAVAVAEVNPPAGQRVGVGRPHPGEAVVVEPLAQRGAQRLAPRVVVLVGEQAEDEVDFRGRRSSDDPALWRALADVAEANAT